MQERLHLICDVLDNQLIDAEGRPLGRADGIVLEWRPDAPPRVAAIAAGGRILAARLHPRLGALAERLNRRFGLRRRPLRFDFGRVIDCGIDIRLDLQAGATEALVYEDALRERVVKRIPGSGRRHEA